MAMPAAVNFKEASIAARRCDVHDKLLKSLENAIMQFRLAGKFVQAANLMIELSIEDATNENLMEDAVELFV